MEKKQFEMDKENTVNEVVRDRSYAACVRDGFRLITNYPRSIVGSTWVFILALAIAGSLYYTMVMAFIGAAGQATTVNIALLAITYVLMLVAIVLFEGRVLHLLRDYRQTGRMTRLGMLGKFGTTLHVSLRVVVFLVIEVVVSVLIWLLNVWAFGWLLNEHTVTGRVAIIGGMFVVAAVAVTFLLPLNQSFYQFTLFGGNFPKVLRTSYALGFRHKGKVLATSLLMLVLLGLLMLVAMLPSVIVMLANGLNTTGIMMGDPDGVPGYFGVLVAAAFAICMAFCCYLSIAFIASLFYVYCSVEVQEAERTLLKEKINDNITTL